MSGLSPWIHCTIMLSLSRDKCPETQWCSSSLPSARCWRAADALTNTGCLGMTSHPNSTKGTFPLLSITQNICIQIYRFILVHLLLWLISCCLVNTSEQLDSFVKWRTASQAVGARHTREARRGQSWGTRRALRSPRSRGRAQPMTCCCLMRLDHYFCPSTTAVSATTFSAVWQLVTKMHPPSWYRIKFSLLWYTGFLTTCGQLLLWPACFEW